MFSVCIHHNMHKEMGLHQQVDQIGCVGMTMWKHCYTAITVKIHMGSKTYGDASSDVMFHWMPQCCTS